MPKTGRRPSGWPEQFLKAKEFLEPILLAAGLRFVAVDQDDTGHNACAEYLRRGERMRLVWGGADRVLWIEVARELDAQIISRWTDIEWILAGARRPLNPDTSDGRIAELVTAVAEYLERGVRAPAVPTSIDAEQDGDD